MSILFAQVGYTNHQSAVPRILKSLFPAPADPAASQVLHCQAMKAEGALCLPFELAAAHLCPALMQTGGVPCGRRVLPHVQPRLPCEAGLQ